MYKSVVFFFSFCVVYFYFNSWVSKMFLAALVLYYNFSIYKYDYNFSIYRYVPSFLLPPMATKGKDYEKAASISNKSYNNFLFFLLWVSLVLDIFFILLFSPKFFAFVCSKGGGKAKGKKRVKSRNIDHFMEELKHELGWGKGETKNVNNGMMDVIQILLSYVIFLNFFFF